MPTETKNLTLTEKADAAFRQAAIQVIERARQTGTPVIVWENHEVKEVEPQKGIEGSNKGSQRRTRR
jgi:hypothetical protein